MGWRAAREGAALSVGAGTPGPDVAPPGPGSRVWRPSLALAVVLEHPRHLVLAALNRASKLEDGRQILVPTRGKPAPTTSATAAAPAASSGPVNLNTATLEQLETLDGVGPATAQKIVDYREQHGGFKSVDELDQVSGIGEKRLAALRDHVGV